MKKLIAILAIMAMSLSAWADETFEVEDLAYTVLTEPSGDDFGTVQCDGLSTAGKSGTSLDIKIPYYVANGDNYYTVSYLKPSAFRNCTNINSAVISYGIQRIHQQVFNGCSNLTSVHIPSSITGIDAKAFYNCPRLEAIYCASTSPSKIANLGGRPVEMGSSIKLYVPWCVSIDDYQKVPMWSTTFFASISHSSDAYDYFFENEGGKMVVTKAATDSTDAELTIIGYTSTSLSATVYKPVGPTQYIIGHGNKFNYVAVADSAFYGNTSLTTLDLSNLTLLESFGADACRECTNLAVVKLAGGFVGEYAFRGCSKLSSVTLNGVTGLATRVFYECPSITTLTIPASVTEIGAQCFVSMSGLRFIAVNTSNPNYSSYNGALYNKDKSTLMFVPQAYNSTSFTFYPGTVKRLANSAFSGSQKITSISVPYGVEEFDNYVFYGCQSLTTLDIPSTVTTLGWLFCANSPNLTDVYINTSAIPINSAKNFSNAANVNLHVAKDSIEAFQAAGWTGFASYNKDGVVASDYQASNGLCYTVTSTENTTLNGSTWAGTCKVVRGRTAANVTGATSVGAGVYIGGKTRAVTAIDEKAFNTTNSFSITNCDNVASVGRMAFSERPLTGSIDLPSVTSIADSAFYKTQIEVATLGSLGMEKVTFGYKAFYYVQTLKEIFVKADSIDWTHPDFFGVNNNDEFNFYVNLKKIYRYTNDKDLRYYNFNGQGSLSTRIVPWFIADHSILNMGTYYNSLDFTGSGLNAYIVTGRQEGTNILTTAHVDRELDGKGVILTDLTPGQLYKVKKSINGNIENPDNLLYPNKSDYFAEWHNSYLTKYFLWDYNQNKFIPFNDDPALMEEGRCNLYLKGAERQDYYLDIMLPAGVTGDLNDDGIVDITDVNMVINMVLGKADKTSAADVDGSGDVDITDVNLIINIMLGK